MYLKNVKPLAILKISTVLFVALLAASCDKDEDPNTQINSEIKAIDDFLDASVTEPTLFDQRGIRIVLHQIGDNEIPGTGQTVRFNYKMKLFSTGQVIESGTIENLLEKMPTDGLRYSLTALLGGSTATFYIPSLYCYGEAGTDVVPPNSTLVYEILSPIEVIKTTAEQTQFTADTTTIRQYINANNIKNTIKLSSGVWYTIDAVGTGKYPTPYDNVSFQYKGTIMSNGSVFQESTLTDQSLFGLIDGLKIGMPRMKEGGAATFYIPSGFAYGVAGNSQIPANANVIFRIQLNFVKPYFD